MRLFVRSRCRWRHRAAQRRPAGQAPPPPYRWVDPPQDLVADNESPQPAHTLVEFTPEGFKSINVFTGDGQAFLILPVVAFTPREGQTGVMVDIKPSAASKKAKVPKGLSTDGNAYAYSATYVPSGAQARLVKDATVVLRFPISASRMARLKSAVWVPLESEASPQSSQLFAKTRNLGVFVALGDPPEPQRRTPWWAVGLIGIVALVAPAVPLERRHAARRRAKSSSKREAPRGRGRHR